MKTETKNKTANIPHSRLQPFKNKKSTGINDKDGLHVPEILFITSYPPRQCGIATYSHANSRLLFTLYYWE